MITTDSVVALQPDVRYRVVDEEEGVIVRQQAGEVIVVNSVGACFLRLVDGERSIASIAEDLENQFEIDAQTLLDDLVEFAVTLEGAGVITKV